MIRRNLLKLTVAAAALSMAAGSAFAQDAAAGFQQLFLALEVDARRGGGASGRRPRRGRLSP